jgi:two-component system catabolic regulation response regulator CreB/two-component system response regulator ChvI
LTPTTTASNDNNDSKNDNNNNSYQHEGETQKKEPAVTYRILLVDDDPDILLTFKEGLEEEEHDVDKSTMIFVNGAKKIQVDTFADPKEALSSFKAGVYDLLLLDIRMRDMNGFELYEELKKIDDKPKVCFITAYELYYEALKKDFPKLDVGCFIKKPISIEDLGAEVVGSNPTRSTFICVGNTVLNYVCFR